MWYVIQTLGGKEEGTVDMIRKKVSSYYMEECFVPKKERMKKFYGSWHKVEDILFPGYVFAVTDRPDKLYEELKRIPRLTKVLGREEQYFTSLNEREVKLVRELGNQEHRTEISKVQVCEGKRIRVVEGPLKNYVGNIAKVNLHKKEVLVQVDFMGRERKLYLGIEMVEIEHN